MRRITTETAAISASSSKEAVCHGEEQRSVQPVGHDVPGEPCQPPRSFLRQKWLMPGTPGISRCWNVTAQWTSAGSSHGRASSFSVASQFALDGFTPARSSTALRAEMTNGEPRVARDLPFGERSRHPLLALVQPRLVGVVR